MSDDDTTTEPHDEDDFDIRDEVLLDPDDEYTGPDWYPRLWNMSAATMLTGPSSAPTHRTS